MNAPSLWTQLRDFFWSDPFLAILVAAAIIALATTPIAFAVLGRLNWFQARRGRTLQRPSFASVVVGMMLVMGIPAIFLALAVKSRYFDKDRYEFDPNQTLTVIDQGRQYHSREEIQKAITEEMDRLALERKNLVDNVKKLDDAMIGLRAVAGQSPAVAQAMPNVLQRLAGMRKSVGVDGPQQLMDFTAPPVEIAKQGAQPAAQPAPVASAPAPAAAPPPANGLGRPIVDAELASVPDAQKPLAQMLPLVDVPAGWTIGTGMGSSGSAHFETFNADNLFEKIDGRAESFIQYDVKGMAYTFYHPVGDDSGDVQLYIFEMGNSLKALGKFGTEKPEDSKPISIGNEGYTAAGSLFFYQGKYYTQIVSNKEDPRYEAFAIELAKRVAAAQGAGAVASKDGQQAAGGSAATPEALFALLPSGPKKSAPVFAAQDVFGYSFLSDVFMADYEDGGVTWQGFLRSYPSAEAAKAVFEKYVSSAKQDGAEIKVIETDEADRMIVSSNIGLIDCIFLKGNAIGGANGSSDRAKAEGFARSFAQKLPAKVPVIDEGGGPPAPDGENAQ